MPVHTILGATGATGSPVLRFLLSSRNRDRQIHIFVRSKEKLLASLPTLKDAKNVQIFTSDLTDNETLRKCLQDSEVIYNCVATNLSTRGVSVARDAADAILASLQHLRDDQGEAFRPPLLALNRSSLLNSTLSGQDPGLAVPKFALGYLFDDLRAACEKYEVATKDDLLSYIFVDHPAFMIVKAQSERDLNLCKKAASAQVSVMQILELR